MNKSSCKKEKHKRKNNKGFTLVELLVTISILGLITIMSLPIIRNIIEANNLKKYATYKDSVETSAKLYVDSYSEDLFGKNKSGCAYITYDQMKDKNLIKNIQENNVSCDSDKTYVRVVKLNGKYTYATQIGCGNYSGNEKIASSKVNVLYPEKGVPRNETCSYDAAIKLSVKVSPYESYEKTDKKKYALKIILESVTGINNRVQVSYAWHKEGTDSSKDIWQDATFRSMSSSKQEEQILNNKTITLKSNEILTPAEETGSYKLLVKINNAMDITGTNLITDLNKAVTFGPYKIDNQPPVINSLSVSSANQSYNTFKAKININATDNNMLSSQNDVKVCIKTNTSSCSSNDYKKYASSYDITIPGEKYDGSKERVYVYVKDNAGNVTSRKVDYTIYKECSVVVKDKNNVIKEGTCSKKCGNNGTKMDTVGTKDKHTGAKCSETMKNVTECNRFDCCNKVTYKDSNVCSKKCGGGTYGQNAYSKYDSSIRCPSKDTSSGGSSCNTQSCCDDIIYKEGDKCSKTCGGGTHNRVAYSKTDGSRCPSKDISSGGSSCNTQSCCEKFTYGSWKDWSSWGTCSAACGTGKQTRTRTRPKFSTYDKSSCGNDIETQSRDCTIKPTCCTGATVSYSSWSECSNSCGTGVQTRKKTTIPCEGSPSVVTETKNCTVITPDQYVSSTAWSCNVSCGTGINERYNTYKKCDGSTYRVKETGSACDTGKSCCTGDKLIKTGNWSCAGVCGTGTQQRTNTYQKCDGSTYTKTEKGSSCSLEPCKPNKPTITNPTNGNWTNKDFSLTVKTTTTSNLGYWYYSYDKKNWVIYNKENYNSYGKKEFITSPFSAERNQPVYIRVCNIKASAATDSTNCSDYASTNIRIDKTPPPSPKYNGLDILNNTFYTTSNDCSGKGGHNYDESCTINVTTNGWYFYFETNTNVVDNNNGSGIKKTQYIWNHNGPAVKCPNWTDDCSPWEINKNGNRGNYLQDCERGIDNVGNVGYSLCMNFYIKWPS